MQMYNRIAFSDCVYGLRLRIAFTFGFRIATSDDAMHSGCFNALWVLQCILGVAMHSG